MSQPAPEPVQDTKPLPWFAEDLAPEDLALVLSTADSTESELAKRDVSRERLAFLKQNALQWEGYLDERTKRRIVLGENEADMTPEKREIGHYIGIDCEMVGVGPGGRGSALARVSLVNWHGHVILDKFVRPQERVTDYRTWVSGVRPRDLINAPTFAEVQAEVATLIKGRVLVGHAIENDMRALMLSHPRPQIRDTAQFAPLREIAGRKQPGLRSLAKLVLGIEIQKSGHEHSSVEDARTTMAIFRTQKDAWDRTLGISKTRKRPAAHAGLTINISAAKSLEEEKLPTKSPRTQQATSPLGTLPSPRSVQLTTRMSQMRVRRDTARVRAAPEWWLND